MFHQVAPSVCWTSYASPDTLVNVGSDVIAMRCQNIVIFHDVKTKQKSYFKGDTMSTCAGIAVLAGHKDYPLFAVAEAVLRPSIYVLKYPEMEKLIHLPPQSVSSYVDMHMSEKSLLLAISSAPDSTLYVWNYRTGEHYARIETVKECKWHCLFVSTSPEVTVIKFSVWHQELTGWNFCASSEGISVNETRTIKLGDEYDKSSLFGISFGDIPYIVNDYGQVSKISPGLFAVKLIWSVPEPSTTARAYKLFHHNDGLLVVNDTSVYYIKEQQRNWILDWQIPKTDIVISKMVSNANGVLYASTVLGNVYSIEKIEGIPTLNVLSNSNCVVIDYAPMKGLIKDEAVLILTEKCELRLVDIINMNPYSSMQIEDACCIDTHHSGAFAVVGTRTGQVHFLSYEKFRKPTIMSTLQFDDDVMISQVILSENVTFVCDALNGINIVCSNYREGRFETKLSLTREDKRTKHFIKSFLLDHECAIIFVSTASDSYKKYAKYLWVLTWHTFRAPVQRRSFTLPHLYFDFTIIEPHTEERVEFVGIRKEDYIFDLLLLEDHQRIIILSTFHTYHFGHLSSIGGSRNILTSATQGIIYHFHTHKKSPRPYSCSRPLLTTFVPRLRLRMDDCFRSRFLLVLYAGGFLMAFRMPPMSDLVRENKRIENENEVVVDKYHASDEELRTPSLKEIKSIPEKDPEQQQKVIAELKAIRKAMVDLINYDISVTGQSHGIFRKFCLNSVWLMKLTEGARILCDKERSFMLEAIKDQNRVKDWILTLIGSSTSFFRTKLRLLFSNFHLENYTIVPIPQELIEKCDYFRFYDMDLNENENQSEIEDNADGMDKDKDKEKDKKKEDQEKKLNEESQSDEQIEVFEPKKTLLTKHFVIEKGSSVYDHVMSKGLELQDIKNVTFNQMYNEDVKMQIYLIEALKREFNNEFEVQKSLKQEIMSHILEINSQLEKMYCNMNCMLSLLKRDTFTPPELSVPEWKNDEDIERIMTVYDSEITAVNPRKGKETKTIIRSGRLLLWPPEYWKRAIMFMMDGVLEKLWEEEIKKTPLPPDFVSKKEIVEYTRDETIQLKQYDKVLEVLEKDRWKYLKILKDNETKTLNLKLQYILKLNEQVMQILIQKLKYDFAIKHESLRSLNTQKTNFQRIHLQEVIAEKRENLNHFNDYIREYSKVVSFWENSLNDLKTKIETQTYRDKHLDRYFKTNYLNSIPAHSKFELTKIYKRRPKLSAKAFNTASICNEVAERLVSKKHHKFPMQVEVQEFLALVDTLDDVQNCPNQLDIKLWEAFTKLRRQKLEIELRLKASSHQLVEAQNAITFNTKELNHIRVKSADITQSIAESIDEYFDITQNRTLEFVLTMGQVEVNLHFLYLNEFQNFMVLHIDDIHEVNELIKTAGLQKLRAMQRVALFRRQVIYKEWEHKVVRANIEYLRYVYKLILNCKVYRDFLDILQNWKKVEENKDASSALGLIEKKRAERIDVAMKRLRSIEKSIEALKVEVEKVRSMNRSCNRQIVGMRTDITLLSLNRDVLSEEKFINERNLRASKIKAHSVLVDTVRRDYVQILELTTILELQRLRTYPTLGPAPQCPIIEN